MSATFWLLVLLSSRVSLQFVARHWQPWPRFSDLISDLRAFVSRQVLRIGRGEWLSNFDYKLPPIASLLTLGYA